MYVMAQGSCSGVSSGCEIGHALVTRVGLVEHYLVSWIVGHLGPLHHSLVDVDRGHVQTGVEEMCQPCALS